MALRSFGLPWFAALASLACVAARPAPTQPALREALLELRERDQAARGALMAGLRAESGGQVDPKLVEAVRVADAESLRKLEVVLAEPCWPGFDEIGRDGAHALWLLAQHADTRPDLQREALRKMELRVKEGQADAGDFAYLTDRVRVAAGEPQRFGTQFTADADGVQRPFPVEAPSELERRRAELGLPSMAEYARMLSSALGSPARPEPLATFPPRPDQPGARPQPHK